MRVTADKDRCIAAGQCVLKASEVFDQDEETGLVIVKVERPTAEQAANVKLAARLCPSEAIKVEDD
jgi:ferredoxin